MKERANSSVDYWLSLPGGVLAYARWEIEKPTGNSSLFVLRSDSLVSIECVLSSATMMPPERMTERSQSSYAYGRS